MKNLVLVLSLIFFIHLETRCSQKETNPSFLFKYVKKIAEASTQSRCLEYMKTLREEKAKQETFEPVDNQTINAVTETLLYFQPTDDPEHNASLQAAIHRKYGKIGLTDSNLAYKKFLYLKEIGNYACASYPHNKKPMLTCQRPNQKNTELITYEIDLRRLLGIGSSSSM